MKSSISTSCEPSPKAAFFAFLDARATALTRNRESIDLISGKLNFSVAVRHTQPHAQQPQVLLCKIKYAVITVTWVLASGSHEAFEID
jgi:hypothetical protein